MWIALIPSVIALLFALTEVSYHQKHGFPHGIGAAVFAGALFVGTPVGIAIWLLLRARRYRKIASLAETDHGLTWHVGGGLVVAARDRTPRPEYTFTIARYLRRTLTAVPPARLVQ